MPLQTDLFMLFSATVRELLDGVQVEDNAVLMVACSGGVDSMTLLHLTQRYACANGLRVIAAHVNHGVRQRAAADEEFVQDQCSRLGIPCFVARLTELYASEPEAREGLLRERRYKALFNLVRQHHAVGLLAAHHADDQLETILWRLIRGTSLTGISGMHGLKERDGVAVLRPLLQFSKAQIQEYAEQIGLPYIVDETNESVEFTRNALRHNVIPQLKKIQPHVLQAVTKFSHIVQEEDSWLEETASEIFRTTVTFESNRAKIDTYQLHTFPVPLQRRAIKILLYCLASIEWKYEHVDSVLQVSKSDTPSARVQLPAGLTAWRIYSSVYVGEEALPYASQGRGSKVSLQWTLADSDSLAYPEQSLSSRFFCQRWTRSDSLVVPATEAVIPNVKAVEIRTADTSERVRPFGMKGTKKLQDVFVDSKVPRQVRHLWPVVCIGNEIVWVPGLLRTDLHVLTGREQQGWRLTFAAPWFDQLAGEANV